MTTQQVSALLAILVDSFPRQSIRAETVRVYRQMLADLPFELCEAAVRKHIASSNFFPTVAELRKLATMPSDLPEADEAWGEVMHAAAHVGRYRLAAFSCPEVARTVDAIGWEAICNTPTEQLATLRAQFRMAYDLARSRTLDAQNAGRLAPEPERQALGARTGRELPAGGLAAEVLRALTPGERK